MREKAYLLAAILAAVLACVEHGRVKLLATEKNRLSVELAHARIPLQPLVIRDSIPVVTQTVVEVPRRDLVDALAAERQLVKDLSLKLRQLEALQTTTLKTADTVAAQYQPHDSAYYYSDQWAEIALNLRDTTFYYNIRDSLATLVYRDYRHRFLWWRWGTRGYRLKIVNFNPHARVTYNRYIKAGK